MQTPTTIPGSRGHPATEPTTHTAFCDHHGTGDLTGT